MGRRELAEISNKAVAYRCYINIHAKGFASKPFQSYITVSEKSTPNKIIANGFLEDQPAVADDCQAGILLIYPPLPQAYNADLVTGGRITKQRWAWFSSARRRDDELGTRLGTLNYLPLEIRQIIYFYIVQYYHFDRFRDPESWKWRYYGRHEWIERAKCYELGYTERRNSRDNPNIWEYNSYSCSYPDGTLATFRLTSPTIKEEYEYWFLHTREFAFESPFAYREFMEQLTAEQQGWIRSVRIEIMSGLVHDLLPDTQADQALMSICDELPTTLQAVSLAISQQCQLHVSILGGATRKKIRNLTRAADLLSTLRKRVLRRIPGVETFLGGRKYEHLDQETREFLQRAWDEDVDL